MYERFFGLDELPFQLTPDPRYLFLSSKHREALGHLVYGIREGAGFVCITGEIGAGKTTLLRALLREADESTKYAYILNPVLAGVELLQEINHELGAPSVGSRRDLLVALNQTLLDQKAAGRRVVLVIDEAQALEGAILEQLRLLSNFETETAKLLQIVLVGQPELRDLLARPDLEQLNQRVTVRWHLGRLDRAETEQYVAHRVATAGQPRGLFTRGAIGLVHAYSRGVPRLINVVCHRALLVAYATDTPRVNRSVVRHAIAELRRHLPVRAARPERTWTWVGAGAGAAVAATLAGVLLWQRPGASPGTPDAAPPAPAAAAGAALDSAPGDPPGGTANAGGASAGPAAPGVAEVTPPDASAPVGDAPVAGVAPAVAADGDGVAEAVAVAVTEDAPNHLEIERASLAEALRQTSPGNSAYDATEALLRAWNLAPLTPKEASSPTLDLQRIARARGVEYLSLTGNLNLLRVLDLPAILEVAPEDGSASRFVTVSHLDDTVGRVSVGQAVVEVSPTVLSEAWFGKSHLFWRDIEKFGGVLSVGTVRPEVRRLHTLLRDVGAYTGPDSPMYSPQTEEAVLRFQRGKRLFADGKAGPMTMITLYQSIGDERVPRLGGEPERPQRVEARLEMGGGGN